MAKVVKILNCLSGYEQLTIGKGFGFVTWLVSGKYRWRLRHVSGRLFRHPNTACFVGCVSNAVIVGATEKAASENKSKKNFP